MDITRDGLAIMLRKERKYKPEYRNDVYAQVFAPYAWPGGYPIAYYVAQRHEGTTISLLSGDVLCHECARREVLENRGAVCAEIEHESESGIYCDDCGAEIAPPPDEEECDEDE